MEENSENKESEVGSETTKSDVGFPEAGRHKKRSYGVLVLITLSLIVAGFFVYSIFFGGESSDKFMKNISPTPVSEIKVEATVAPQVKSLDKKEMKVNILNGSGTPGLAGELKKKIEALGFSDISTGNADRYDYKSTKVSFAASVSESVKSELVADLKKTYESVESEDKKVGVFDIEIIIGQKSSKVTPTPAGVKVSPTGTKSPTLVPAM